MKKIAVLLILSALIFGACTPSETPDTGDDTTPAASDTAGDTAGESETSPNTPAEEAAFSLVYKDVRLTPGVHMDVESVLGTPADKTEAPSCVHDGNDIVYFYDDIEVVTSPSDQGEYIVSVTVIAGTVTTEEGIRLGANISDAIAACGEAEEAFGRYVFTRGNTTLTMMTDDDGIILSISYGLAE